MLKFFGNIVGLLFICPAIVAYKLSTVVTWSIGDLNGLVYPITIQQLLGGTTHGAYIMV